jgi:hypothetical protein
MSELKRTDDVEDVTARLSDRFGDSALRAAVRARVLRNFSVFQNAAVRDFVPLFVERRVRAELHP